MSRLKPGSLEEGGEAREGWAGLRAGVGRSRAGPCLTGESGQCPSLQTHAPSQVGGFTGNAVWWLQPAHQDCRERDITSEEGATQPLILWQRGKERGPKSEEEEEEIGDGQSTAPLMPGGKISHLLVITVVAYEKCSEEVAQVPTLHQQIRLRAVLETLWTEFTSTVLSYWHAIQIDSATLVFPPSHLPACCFWQFSKGFNPPLCFESRAVLSWPTSSYKCTHWNDHCLLTFFSDSLLSNEGRI